MSQNQTTIRSGTLTPEMHYVDSSNVEAIGYDPATQELYVQFLTSGTYVYLDVEESVFDEFLQAPSKGQYLNWNVKGRYQFETR